MRDGPKTKIFNLKWQIVKLFKKDYLLNEKINKKLRGGRSKSDNYFSELLVSDEDKSVKENGGYYIGRYEAGDKESTIEQKIKMSLY